MSATLRITESKLHQYLADAYMRGADHEGDGVVPTEYELRVAASEAWAREYIELRLENGLLALLDDSEPVGWAPYMEDEDIPTPEGGLLYEGETGRLIAYRTEQQARDSMVHGTALPLYASPTPTKPEGFTPTERAHFCNQAGPMGGGCEDSWPVGGNYGSHVCRNPAHHEPAPEPTEGPS